MRQLRTYIFLVALATTVTFVAAPVSAGDLAVPTENALWQAAGQAYAEGVDKSAAMQQYRLFVQTYKKLFA